MKQNCTYKLQQALYVYIIFCNFNLNYVTANYINIVLYLHINGYNTYHLLRTSKFISNQFASGRKHAKHNAIARADHARESHWSR